MEHAPGAPLSPEELLSHTAWMGKLARKLVLGADQVDDLVQDAWAAALTSAPRADVPLRAWLAGILRKRALFFKRTEGRLKDRESRAGREADRGSALACPGDLSAQAELQEKLLGHVNALPEKYRRVLLLRYWKDAQPAAIARQLGLPVNTVNTHLQRALEQLRQRLDDSYSGDRRAWGLAWVPFANTDGPRAEPAVSSAAAPGVSWLVSLAASGVALVGVAAFLWDRDPVPDVREYGTGAQAAERLFANGSVAADSPAHGEWQAEQASQRVPLTAQASKEKPKNPAPRTTTLEVEVIDASSGRPVPRYHLFASYEHPEDAKQFNLAPEHSIEVLQYKGVLEIPYSEAKNLWVEVCVLGSPTDVRIHPVKTALKVKPVASGKTPVRFEIDLDAPEREPGAQIAFGRVLDRDTGEPIAGVEIWVHPFLENVTDEDGRPTLCPEPPTRCVQSFSDGRFRIAMDEGGPKAIFSAYHPHYGFPTISELVANPRREFDGTTEALIRLSKRASLRGQLVDGSGQPLANVPLLCILSEPNGRWVTFELDRSARWRLTTDIEGKFNLPHLIHGRYHVFVLPAPNLPDDAAIANASYSLAPGEQKEIVLQVDAPDAILVRGYVGAPIPADFQFGAFFLPYKSELGWALPRPEFTGYTAGKLSRGTYLVMLAPIIDDNDGPFALIPKILVQGVGEQIINFDYPSGSLSGIVTLPSPPNDLVVLATPILPAGFAQDFLASGKLNPAISYPVDPNGYFKVKYLAPGPVRLELYRRSALQHSAGKPLASQEVSVSGQTVLEPWVL